MNDLSAICTADTSPLNRTFTGLVLILSKISDTCTSRWPKPGWRTADATPYWWHPPRWKSRRHDEDPDAPLRHNDNRAQRRQRMVVHAIKRSAAHARWIGLSIVPAIRIPS